MRASAVALLNLDPLVLLAPVPSRVNRHPRVSGGLENSFTHLEKLLLLFPYIVFAPPRIGATPVLYNVRLVAGSELEDKTLFKCCSLWGPRGVAHDSNPNTQLV